MHLVSRLRRILAMMIVLLGLLAGLGAASAQADAPPSIEGGRRTPHTAEHTPGIAAGTPLPSPSPSPIQTITPISSATPSPSTPSSTTSNTDGAGSSPSKPSDKADSQAAHTVRFDPADGGTPTQSSVKTGTLAIPPQHNPQREGFRFDGWTLDGRPYDFRTPVLKDTTLKAQWSKTTDWTLSPDHGPATGARLTINPPGQQEPHYTSIQAAGDQTVGLTGDGRIHTRTQEGTPVQVPSPMQASDGFHYLQATAGDHWRAALGSDQRIYTWDNEQAAPTLLDAGQDTRFTSISLNDDRLLAVDRQGRVHTYRASRDPERRQHRQRQARTRQAGPGHAHSPSPGL